MAPILRPNSRKRKAKDNNEDPMPKTRRRFVSREVGAIAAKFVSAASRRESTESIAIKQTMNNLREWFDRFDDDSTQPNIEDKFNAVLHDTSRLVARHNIRRLAAMVQAQSAEARLRLAGQSIVELQRTEYLDKTATIELPLWTDGLATSLALLFDCKTTKTLDCHDDVAFRFYGIDVNAAAAGMAFQKSFHLIANQTMNRKLTDDHGRCNTYAIKLNTNIEDLRNKQTMAPSYTNTYSKAGTNIFLSGWGSQYELEMFRIYAAEITNTCIHHNFNQPIGKAD